MSEILFATSNPNKTLEVKKILGAKFLIRDLNDIQLDKELEENEPTLEGNAISKARQAIQYTDFDSCFAEDTGLEIEALGGAPGIYSARFAGEDKSSEKNIDKVLHLLKNVANRAARFRTVVAHIDHSEVRVFEGMVNGTIAHSRLGISGFGYDPVFIPDGYSESFAQLPLEVKNEISHRAKAFEKFLDWINSTRD
nr:RdgB/HAM1 family non-canonical purine NTP pyrophosphatase [Saprospiraceae bacterium]